MDILYDMDISHLKQRYFASDTKNVAVESNLSLEENSMSQFCMVTGLIFT